MPSSDTYFKPGHPGMGGRPRKRPITDRYIEVLEDAIPEKVRKKMEQGGFVLRIGSTWGDALAQAAVLSATSLKHGTLSRKDIREAIEGKAPQRLEIHSQQDRTLEVVVTYVDAPVQNKKLTEKKKLLSSGNGDGSTDSSARDTD